MNGHLRSNLSNGEQLRKAPRLQLRMHGFREYMKQWRAWGWTCRPPFSKSTYRMHAYHYRQSCITQEEVTTLLHGPIWWLRLGMMPKRIDDTRCSVRKTRSKQTGEPAAR